jgi:hypothetical protein
MVREWAIPLGVFLLGCAALWRAHVVLGRTLASEARQRKQMDMLKEAIALNNYGAHEEAVQLLEEAKSL